MCIIFQTLSSAMVGSIVGMQSSEILQVASEYEVKVCVILLLTTDFNLSLSSLFSLSFSLLLSSLAC